MASIAHALGLIGGFLSLLGSLYYLFSGSFGEVVSLNYAGTLNNLALATVPVSVLCIVFSGCAGKKPKDIALFLFISSVFIYIFLKPSGFFAGSIILFFAGIFALLSENWQDFSSI